MGWIVFAADAMERDRFLSPAEALGFGLIDSILEHPPPVLKDANNLPVDVISKTDLNAAEETVIAAAKPLVVEKSKKDSTSKNQPTL